MTKDNTVVIDKDLMRGWKEHDNDELKEVAGDYYAKQEEKREQFFEGLEKSREEHAKLLEEKPQYKIVNPSN